ncbi:MAG: hypothetical protein QOH46_1202 [Solirubrobacteraceae bacterium]|jgi:hypothetical protein|nr:hypothetical protein [Solirubrobacteraceae bacterium]
MTTFAALLTPRLGTAVAAALAAALGWPVPGRAGDTTVPGTCFAAGQRVVVNGVAFTPGAPVTISGAATGAAQAGPTGAFTTQIVAPPVRRLGPVRMTLVMTDGANPANVTTVALDVVRQAFGSNLPLAGEPNETTTWRFAGFLPDRPIYGHFVLGGRSHGDHRFGMARGGCGTLTTRAERIPGVRDLRPGAWTVKLDQRRTYRESAPGSTHSFPVRPR